jgi:hypothetical protein
MRIAHRLAAVCCCIAVIIFATGAEAAKYDDLAAWAKRSNANTQQFVNEINKCKTPRQVAAALKAKAERENKITDELIKLIAIHPELKDLPDLGLDTETFKIWREMKPDADARRQKVPDEPVEISQQLLAANASIKASPQSEAAIKIILANQKDSEVAAAANELHKTQEINHRRLLSAFL